VKSEKLKVLFEVPFRGFRGTVKSQS